MLAASQYAPGDVKAEDSPSENRMPRGARTIVLVAMCQAFQLRCRLHGTNRGRLPRTPFWVGNVRSVVGRVRAAYSLQPSFRISSRETYGNQDLFAIGEWLIRIADPV